MKKLVRSCSVLLIAVLEIILGIALFRDPYGFTAAAIRLFGVFLALIGVVYLFRGLFAKKYDVNPVPLYVGGVVTLALGILMFVANNALTNVLPALVILYGIVNIVLGVYKLTAWLDLRVFGLRLAPLVLLSAILSIVCGIIFVLNPFTAADFALKFTAVAMIVEAAIDILSILLNLLVGAKKE